MFENASKKLHQAFLRKLENVSVTKTKPWNYKEWRKLKNVISMKIALFIDVQVLNDEI